MTVTRRAFLSEAAAFAAAPSVFARGAAGARLTLGVLSDIHVGCAGWEQWHEFMNYNVHTLVRALHVIVWADCGR